MIYLLPPPKSNLSRISSAALQKAKRIYSYFISKKGKYAVAAFLDFILIAVILILGRQPAQMLISPIVTSFQSLYSQAIHRTTSETFAFVPGLARNKFSDIDLEGLTALSFFDVPLDEKGEMYLDSRGYASFTSSEAAEVFDRARYNKTKIFLTLSAYDEETIFNILTNSDFQNRVAEQAIEQIKINNIDGITIDFEYPKGRGVNLQQEFTDFISLLTNRIHADLPQAQVAVAVPSSLANKQSLYNEQALAKVSDKIFLVASDFIVPEVKSSRTINPVYGFSEKEYVQTFSNLLGRVGSNIPANKLVMERAWYGNGDKYPLYVPSSRPVEERNHEPSDVVLDYETIERLVAGVPQKSRQAARVSIPLIGKALEEEGILDSNVLAYALATIEHETDETFEPIEEIQGSRSARRLGYEGGMNYYGRGYIQITHLRNYRIIGERIGMGDKLAKNPELASDPQIAAKVLAAYFADNNVANLASRGSFVAARTPVNPDYNGYSVARLAMKYVE